jgi:hypothetical protein
MESTLSLNHEMSKKHEHDLAKWFGTRVSPGSGNKSNRPMDGRTDHLDGTGLAWDGKATRGKSIGVSVAMWEKAKEQAHAELPMLALRFYGNDRLDQILADLAVVNVHDLIEILEKLDDARQMVRAVLEGEVSYPYANGDPGYEIFARGLDRVLG